MSSRSLDPVHPAPRTRRAASTLAVPFDASGVTQARRWAILQCADLGVRSADVRDDAELIVSELVANAVLHGAAPVVVMLSLTPAELEVAVTDAGPPPYRFGGLPPDRTATSGRGLAIVAVLAPLWGVSAQRPGPGKTVWCRLPLAGAVGD